MTQPPRITLARPWLCADLGAPHRVLSFAPHNPGFVMARRILWREVRNADLSPEVDALQWFAGQMAARGDGDAVGMLTSRSLDRYCVVRAEVEGLGVTCVATVGLGNGESAGARRPTVRPTAAGTINIAVILDHGLTETAQIEALTIAAQARTAAVMDAGVRLESGAPITGTGTDCIALAAPPGDQAFAGLHTATGEALGRAVRQAVAAGAAGWIAENGLVASGYPEDAV